MDRHKYILLISANCLIISILFMGCIGSRQPNLVTEKYIIDNTAYIYDSLAISGNTVVWCAVNHIYGTYGIYGYDIEKKVAFPIETLRDYANDIGSVAISGDIVVWCEYSKNTDLDIWGYNLKANEKFPVCTDEGKQLNPRISGDIILWQNDLNDIFVENLVTGEEFKIPIGQRNYQRDIDISGDTIVRVGEDGIYGYNIKDRKQFLISSGYDKHGVRINGNKVIWLDTSPTTTFWHGQRGGDIIVYDLTTKKEKQLPRTWAYTYWYGYYPAIGGDFVVWSCGDEHSSDVYGYDLASETKFPISVNFGVQRQVAIDGNTVIWYDLQNGKTAIFGATISQDSVLTSTTTLCRNCYCNPMR